MGQEMGGGLSRVGEGGKLLGRPAASSLTFGHWIEG